MSEFDDPVDEDPPEEYSRPRCLVCGCEFEWQYCWNDCDEGYFDGYDEDPLWYDPGDLIRCSVRGGRGVYLACPNAENHVKEKGE